MKTLVLVATCACMILTGPQIALAEATTVVESISGSAGDWTYTYTLTNNESLDIYHWAVWFPSNPNATSVTTGSDWRTTFSTKGYFPQQYVAEGHADHVYDSTADPFHAGTANPLVGPNSEPGFYSVYADDYMTTNAGEYWDDDSWEDLPDTEPAWDDPLWDKFWRGSKYGGDFGWTEGAGGNVATAYGISNGSTGDIIIEVSTPIAGAKSFSYNTTDYYYGINDWAKNAIYLDFEGSGTVVPEPGAVMALVGMGLIMGLAILYRRRRNGR